MSYFVVDPSGTSYGPADEGLLRQWAQEGRVLPETTIRDANTGQTMAASTLPGLFGPGAAMYGPSPFPQSSPYYPRPQSNTNNDITIAWIMAAIGAVCAVCVCSLIGLGLGIVGVIFAKRAIAADDQRGQTPLILSYVAIGLSAVMLVVNVIGLSSVFAGGGG